MLPGSPNRGQSALDSRSIPTCDLKGRVHDGEGHPIPKAIIKLKQEDIKRETLTDEAGDYIFVKLPQNTAYNLSILKEGYIPIPDHPILVSCSYLTGVFRVKNNLKFCGPYCGQNLNILDDCESTSTETGTRTAQIAGYVYDANAAPISGVIIKAKASGKQIKAAETDENGYFNIAVVEPGKYEISAGGDQYKLNVKIRRIFKIGDDCKLLFILVASLDSPWVDR